MTLIVVGAGVDRVRRVLGDDVLAVATLAELPEGDAPVLVFGDPAAPVVEPRVRHVVRASIDDDALAALVRALAAGQPSPAIATTPPATQVEARRVQRALAASRRLAGASDLAATEEVATDAVLELCDADRAHFLFHDAEDGALWSEARLKGDGDDRHAVAGLAGFAARTGLAVSAARAADDPRWSPTIDDAAAEARLLVQPVRGGDGVVHAVIVLARDARRPPFAEAEAAMVASFATLAAPFLDQLSVHIQAQAMIDEDGEGLFRKEAMEAQALPRWGDVVRVSPGWISWAYWVLVALLIGSVVYLAVGTVSTYSSGPAIVRSTTRSDVAARTAGNITEVARGPGQAVTAGTVIARLDDTNQRAAVDRVEHEFETQLRNHMLDPGDAGADGALRALRLQLETARTALEDRLIRAPAAGVITDVRVRGGQHVEPGDIVASVADGSGALEVVALLPGSDRPQLAAGMQLRLELIGYRYAYQGLVIDSVSSDVIGPGEARRVLGAEVADSLALTGPVVVVRGHLPRRDFEVDGRTFLYHDGMLGTAEVRVRSERIVYTLMPGMRRF